MAHRLYTEGPHYLTANLNGTYTVDSMHVWNYYAKNPQYNYNPDTNQNDGTPIDPSAYANTRGVKTSDLYFTESDAIGATAPSIANGWTLLQSGVTFEKAPAALVQAD